jgi:hypothetical protein
MMLPYVHTQCTLVIFTPSFTLSYFPPPLFYSFNVFDYSIICTHEDILFEMC